MKSLQWSLLIVPSLILVSALIDDMKSKKIHNSLVVICLVSAIAWVLYSKGIYGLKEAGFGAGSALLLILPLYAVGMLGGGDLKIMIAFGAATDYIAVFWVLVYSLIWGGLLGILVAVLKGQGGTLARNIFFIALQIKKDKAELNKIPYSVALLFGWLTFVSHHLSHLQDGL